MIVSCMLWGVLAGGVVGSLPPAEKLQISATAAAGSGASVAGAGGVALARRSPFFLLAEVGVSHPQAQWVEFSPGIMLEVEGRVSFGVVPKARLFLPGRRLRAYGLLALPVFLVPFTLVGAQVGAGIEVRVHPRASVVGEGVATGYFLGDDLMDNSALGKFDVQAGVRVYF